MKTLKQIWNKLFGKKEKEVPTPNIREFLDRVSVIAKRHNEAYYKVEIELGSAGCADKGYTFKAYINARGWVVGKTMEECLSMYNN